MVFAAGGACEQIQLFRPLLQILSNAIISLSEADWGTYSIACLAHAHVPPQRFVHLSQSRCII